MGLDCWVQKDVVKTDGTVEFQELWYGRKTNEIHGWMQRQSGIPADDFNCVRFYLTKELLDKLQADHASGALVSTAGFFFGRDTSKEDITTDVQKILATAQEALTYGELPYYFSWW